MHGVGNVSSSRFIDKVKLSNHRARLELCLIMSISTEILVVDFSGYSQSPCWFGIFLEIKVLDDVVNQLWLGQFNESVFEILDLNSKIISEVTHIFYVII